MAEMTVVDLGTGVKEATLQILKQISTHKMKGGDLIINGLTMLQQGLEIAGEVKEQLSAWTEILKQLIAMLKPVFETLHDWIVSAYEHLVELWNWCKDMWHKLCN